MNLYQIGLSTFVFMIATILWLIALTHLEIKRIRSFTDVITPL